MPLKNTLEAGDSRIYRSDREKSQVSPMLSSCSEYVWVISTGLLPSYCPWEYMMANATAFFRNHIMHLFEKRHDYIPGEWDINVEHNIYEAFVLFNKASI